MNSIVKGFTKTAVIRAAVLGILCAVTLIWPDVLANGAMVYVIAGYLLFCGALLIVGTVTHRSGPMTGPETARIVLCALMALLGALIIGYHRYLVGFLPLFLGGMISLMGALFFVMALCGKSSLKPLLILLSIAIGIGGVGTAVFSFGFGGVVTLSYIWGVLLLLSAGYELTAWLTGRKPAQEGA